MMLIERLRKFNLILYSEKFQNEDVLIFDPARLVKAKWKRWTAYAMTGRYNEALYDLGFSKGICANSLCGECSYHSVCKNASVTDEIGDFITYSGIVAVCNKDETLKLNSDMQREIRLKNALVIPCYTGEIAFRFDSLDYEEVSIIGEGAPYNFFSMNRFNDF